ncbi:MAG TPA: FecR family protein, partial [Chitinophagaceae bacterium]|nr:FecR family protein [Chitinophagaceae bacterium]
MNRKAFRQLLKKYVDDSCSEKEKRIVDQWYELLENGHSVPSGGEITELESRLWEKIQSSTTDRVRVLKQRRIPTWKYAAAACITGIMVLIGVLLFSVKSSSSDALSVVKTKVDQGFFEETNNTDTVKNLRLEDGSSVLVYPGSKLAYPKHFGANKREVYLEGEAFFNVTKIPGRPFFVYNNKIVTQVLGTSFSIHCKSGQIEVAVKTGKVAVYENKEQISLDEVQQKSNGVIITPNQKVTYYQQERHFVTSIVDHPFPVNTETDQRANEIGSNYSETPLYDVLRDLEKSYQLEIVLENEKIKNCLFTGDLADQSLFN